MKMLLLIVPLLFLWLLEKRKQYWESETHIRKVVPRYDEDNYDVLVETVWYERPEKTFWGRVYRYSEKEWVRNVGRHTFLR
jgi:hypothetical protein